MVEATLTFARGLTGSEDAELVTFSKFLEGLQADMLVPFNLRGDTDYEAKVRPHALRRARRNVIENAGRYDETAEGTQRLIGDKFVITIYDAGPGIPAADLEKVFDPFYRLEESCSLGTGGHGLGLSIARTIVRAHGGDIMLSNRSPKGLRVTVHLPVGD